MLFIATAFCYLFEAFTSECEKFVCRSVNNFGSFLRDNLCCHSEMFNSFTVFRGEGETKEDQHNPSTSSN